MTEADGIPVAVDDEQVKLIRIGVNKKSGKGQLVVY